MDYAIRPINERGVGGTVRLRPIQQAGGGGGGGAVRRRLIQRAGGGGGGGVLSASGRFNKRGCSNQQIVKTGDLI